ncbi:MAG: ubiquinone biosynthesis protein UbiH, partial [Gallionella sp.]|nr:ubiquinone biosynthesis protein UbiH [Gallionella sp.]
MDFDIVIIGGGLVGASLAAALKDSDLKLALLESSAPPPVSAAPDNWDARIYAFTPGNAEFLHECGAWQRLDMRRVQPVEEMRVFGDTGARLNFSAYQLGATELAFIMESRLLQDALWQVLREQDNLTLLQPARCAELQRDEEAARLTLQDGREITAKLIVGADGRDSWVR